MYTVNERIENATVEHESNNWGNKSEWYWVGQLILQLLKVLISMLGAIKDKPEKLLVNMAAMCANWIVFRSTRNPYS